VTAGPRRAAASWALRRTWMVGVLLAGLLGMHGVASDHMVTGALQQAVAGARHAAMGSLTAVPDPAPPRADAEVPAGVSAGAPAGMPAGRVLHDVLTGSGEDAGSAMPGLCLAVLAVAVLLSAHTRRRLPRGAVASPVLQLSRLLARLRALPPPRPPDLVAGLCVSRS
jgi:hypothetical protein